ncbi:MAG: hypothetical protein KKD18_01950 [Nanoarchaeota archaeon]|nr:hypothetical protein [Nanoarchaeota archaeon]MBU0977155.1 hypothetical protein [Nanoarchaeota archaeon]
MARNWNVVVLSLLALVCMVLTFTVNWMFIALAAIFSGWGWKILMNEGKAVKKKR